MSKFVNFVNVNNQTQLLSTVLSSKFLSSPTYLPSSLDMEALYQNLEVSLTNSTCAAATSCGASLFEPTEFRLELP